MTTSVRSEALLWTPERSFSAGLLQPGYPAAFACIFAGWALLALPWLLGSVVIPYDAVAHFYAQLQFLAQALHSGDSPAWTPHVFAGSPQIADPQSLIFSPAFLLAWLDRSPSLQMFDAYVFAIVLAGCCCVLMFCHDRNWHPAAGIMAALCFGFGASASQRIQHVTQVQGLVFFMAALWLLARALHRTSPLYGLLAGIAAALMIVTPGQVQLLGCYLLAGYVLSHWLTAEHPRRSALRSVGPLAAAGLTVAVLSAIPLLLTFLFGLASNRPHIPFAEAALGSLHPASLLTAFIGDLYGANDAAISYWGPSSADWTGNFTLSQNMGQVYLGALPVLVLMVAGVGQRGLWHKEIRYFTIALACCILYALGSYTPFFTALYDALPGINLFRRPADATFFIGALSSIASGYCLHLLLAKEGREIGARAFGMGAGLFALAFALGLFFAVRQGHLADAAKPLLISGAVTLGAFALLCVLARRRALPVATVILAVACFMTLDLGVNDRPNESTGLPARDYADMVPGTANRTVTFLKANTLPSLPTDRRDRVELLGIGFDWPNSGQIHGYDHTLGYNPLRLEPIDQAIGAGDTVAVPEQRIFTPLFPSYNCLMADLLGLRYIVSPVPIETIDRALKPGDLKEVGKTDDGIIYENKGALPRVMFVANWRLAKFATLIKTGRWPGFDPKETVLVEQPPALPGLRRAGANGISEGSSARLLAYRNTLVDVEVVARKAGLVLLNDVWHPWWFAEVDGHEAPILKANVLFRAVAVPAGRHLVRFTFRPLAGALRALRAMF